MPDGTVAKIALKFLYARALPRRTGGAASAAGMAWPLALACGPGVVALKGYLNFPLHLP